MQKCKSDFLHFLFFGNLEFSSLFDIWLQPLCFPRSNQWFFGQNAQNQLFALFHNLAPPSDPSAPTLMFSEVKSMILRAHSALFAKKCGFRTFSTLGTQKSCESIDQTNGFCGPFIMDELLAKKCTFGALGAHWVPWLSGWLAGWPAG